MSVAFSKQPDPRPPGSTIDLPLIIWATAVVMIVGCWLAWHFERRPFPVDSTIPHHAPANGVSGKVVSVGSDTLTDVMEPHGARP
jgi:hypothetical protein